MGFGVEISCCVLQFAVARGPFVETRVSSSGKTWQAKLIVWPRGKQLLFLEAVISARFY